MYLAIGEQTRKNTALSICDCIDFRVAPAARASKRLVPPPFLRLGRAVRRAAESL